MVAGVAFIHGTFRGFLFFGFSHQHLWFGSQGDEAIALRNGETRAARYWARCGLTTILPIAPPPE